MASRQPNTTKAYLSWYNRFTKWATNFEELHILPASELTITMFILSLVQSGLSSSSLHQCLAAITWIHKLAQLPNPTDSPLIATILEGAKRIVARPTQRKEPLTVEHIRKLYAQMSSTNGEISLMDRRLLTYVLVSFAGFLRFDEAANVKRHDVTFFTSHMVIFLEKSKTDTYRDGRSVMIARINTDLCPVKSMLLSLKQAQISADSSYYIFRNIALMKSTGSYVLRPGNAPISYSRMRELLLQKLTAISLDASQFGTHSLRAGGATAAANMDISERLFLIHGRWKCASSRDRYVKDDLQRRLRVTLNLGL